MRLSFLGFLFLTFSLFSCGSDYDDVLLDEGFSVPLSIGNYWNYKVDSNGIHTRDSLYILKDTLIDSQNYKKFEANENTVANGFYSSSLNNNGIRQVNNTLFLSGSLDLSTGMNLPIDLNVSLRDFIIFKSNAALNELQSSVSATINEEFNGYPMTINYTLKSLGGQFVNDYTSPDNSFYGKVKTSKIVLTLSISTLISGITIPVLSNQDVLVSTQYVSKDIGVVYSQTLISYTVSQFIADQIGIPASTSQVQEEFLNNYFVN
jgi:hypothetical protein